MKYLLSNPHNGSPVDVNGVELLPGFSLEVKESAAVTAKAAHDFLLVTITGGDSKPAGAKPKKLKEHLEWSHVTPPDEDPGPQFVVHGGKPKAAPVRKAVAKKAVKKAKAKK